MHIKKAEIFGFKSFGFRNTAVQFRPGLVSISGPNGSGKSNILDAIIFAMGENKPKVMRVDRLRSLIHDIEGGRRGPKIARSSVQFDNADRKIPVDSDTVEVTRELDSKGENTYYLNRKKTTRGHVLDLLDMANAGLGQLNAVQQGTVTRISEMTPDEKRSTIETMIGLSYFDEKKSEALEQLDRADRQLQIVLVKMGDMKARIDELEEERNQQLRHDLLGRELARYRAIDTVNRLRALAAEKSGKEAALREAAAGIGRLGGERDSVRAEMEGLDSEKSRIMAEANDYNRAKAEIEMELSGAKDRYESASSEVKASRRRVGQIDARLSEVRSELGEASSRRDGAASRAAEAEGLLEAAAGRKAEAGRGQARADAARQAALDRQSRAAARKAEVDGEVAGLTSQMNEARLALEQARRERRDAGERMASNASRLEGQERAVASLAVYRDRLDAMAANHAASISELKGRIGRLEAKRAKVAGDVEELGALLEKSSRAANQYESRIKTVKGFMHEDYTVARLREDAGRLGILGLAYEMISWDRRHERPVLAASSDWLKAVVVRDFEALLGVAEFARSRKLPKLKIIPLEAMPELAPEAPSGPGVIGALSDYVRCDPAHRALRAFLFGGVVLADSRGSARALSRAGHRAVTPDGEFFEARAGTVVIDINSKISKLTRLISMSTDIDGLFHSIGLIRRYMARKKAHAARLERSIRSASGRLSLSERNLASVAENRSHLESRIASAGRAGGQMRARVGELSARSSELAAEISRRGSQVESIAGRIRAAEEGYAGGEQEGVARELERANSAKLEADRAHTAALREHGEASSRLASLRAEARREGSLARGLAAEESSLSAERAELEGRIRSGEEAMRLGEEEGARLRGREQELIASSGHSMDDIRGYDSRLRELSSRERGLTKELGSLERESDSLGRDLRDMSAQEEGLRKVISASGIGRDAETFDVGPVVEGLSAELGSLPVLNARAPELYPEVSDGYARWSPRKNSLEEERDKIVRFIEGVDREKRQTFLDAFDTVDREVRLVFGKMTGGNAWMELQNEDDIFGSGISYLIQFPNKPKRESTSISGGEKTLAAIVFVLALQRLKPSPFYLFDEIDAHLDAPNSERLARILEERSRESQFIMVSLKDSVVKKAGLIYGVYPKNGVSNVIAYKDRRAAGRA